MSRIPKIIHYCWYGGGAKSEKIQRCMESWRTVLPDYEIIEWNEENCDISSSKFASSAYDNKKWAFVADYFRFKALNEHGGIYLDTDVLVHKPFDDILHYSAFFPMECYDLLNATTVGAEPGSEVIKRILEEYEKIESVPSTDSELMKIIVNKIITPILEREYGYKKTGFSQQLRRNIAVFAPNIMIINVEDGQNYCEHLYGSKNSWCDSLGYSNGETYKSWLLTKYYYNLFGRPDIGFEHSGLIPASKTPAEAEPEHTEIEKTVENIIDSERAKSVLEISGFDARFGELIKHSQADGQNITLDRVDLTDGAALGDASPADGWYDNIYGSDILSDVSSIKQYDVIILFHLFENMENTQAKELLEKLLTKANKQVLVLTPEYSYDLQSDDENKKSDFRAYHPIFFFGMAFSYVMLDTEEGPMQAYSFYPKIDYAPLPCDALPEKFDKERKLKIAYVLHDHGKSGALKAIFMHIRGLLARGHQVSVYFREKVAKKMEQGWGIPSDIKIHKKTAVPDNARFLDYIGASSFENGAPDIIILSWMTLTPEFENSKIPVALWEQGSETIYGDYYGELQASGGDWRTCLHTVYRKPVHILAVSPVVQTVLKGIYNRDSQFFPLCIDTDFYHPGPNKQNDIPTVLLVGAPLIAFKGFMAAFSVLDRAYRNGNKFKVQLATTISFTLSPKPVFPFEVIIDPPQEDLAELYRNADIFLSTSLCETFSLPPIEAMSSGTAVISTDNGGINTYAKPGVNCIMCRQGDLKSLLSALVLLLNDEKERKRLSEAGRQAALKFSPGSIIAQLEECLYRIAGHGEASD